MIRVSDLIASSVIHEHAHSLVHYPVCELPFLLPVFRAVLCFDSAETFVQIFTSVILMNIVS